jgi:hypothetical protein
MAAILSMGLQPFLFITTFKARRRFGIVNK